jgi:CHAT domain-containing protein
MKILHFFALPFVLIASFTQLSLLRAEPLPEVCRGLPTNFAETRGHYLNENHRAIARAIKEAKGDWSEPGKKLQDSILTRMRALINAQVRATGSNSQDVAILQVELLQFEGHGIGDAEITRIRRDIRKSFDSAVTRPEAIEAFAIFALNSQNFENTKEHYPALTKAITAHRKSFGDSERQVQLWLSLYDAARSDAEKLAAAHAFADAAPGLGSPRALFEAQLRLFQRLPPEDPLYRRVAEVVALNALAVARTPVPKEGSDESSCFNNFAGSAVTMTSAVSLAASEQDKKMFVKQAVAHLAIRVTYGIHSQFEFEDMSLLFAARFVDYEAFLAAMASMAKRNDDDCKAPNSPAVICGLMKGAQILFENNVPELGIALLQDARVIADAQTVPPQMRWQVRVALVNAEWKHGQKSLAAANIAAVDVAEFEKSASPADTITFHRLRAEIADALLDPDIARQSFSAVIDRAIEFLQKATEDTPYLEREAATSAGDTLVKRHIRGQFCVECGGLVSEPALKWIRNGLNDKNLSAGDAAKKYLFQRALPGPAGTQSETRLFERALINAHRSNWPALVNLARRRLPPGADIVRVLAIASALAGASGVAADVQAVDAILSLIVEHDDKKRKDIWEKRLWNEVFPAYREEGVTEKFQEILDDFARDLSAAGFQAAALFVLDAIEDNLKLDAEPGKNENDGARLAIAKGRPFFWTSIYTRLAVLESAAGKLEDANESLDISLRIAQARLDDEWAKSADRVNLFLREMRPTLQLAAQTRIAVGLSAKSGGSWRAQAFEELQFAMLGETAAGSQAAQLRRLIAEPRLASAILERDSIIARLQLLQISDTIATLDEVGQEQERQKIARELNVAKTTIDSMLPAAESLGSLKPIALTETQMLLRPDEALLILHAGSDGIYGSLVPSSGDASFWRRPIMLADLDKRIQALRKGLEVEGDLPKFPLREAVELYQLILGPVHEQLSKVRSVLVVADGPLVAFPLGVLPTQMPGRIPIKASEYRQAGIKWLGVSHAIAYLPTVRSLEARRAQRLASQAKLQFAGIGNPVLANGTQAMRNVDYAAVFRTGPLADVELLRQQKSLPETETEIRTIAKLLNGREQDLFLRERASEPIVRLNGLGDYRIIMFATHGLMGGELNRMSEPGLILTPPATASNENDGLLTASEIMSLKLDADLVILSACNTAASDGRPRAEGFSGLTRAFLSAGARNVIVTHWSIPSLPAVSITTRIIAEREKNSALTWSEAMRRAFVAMVEEEGTPEFAHPSNWAAFSVVGIQGITR